ncbi:Major Facilitator Superfamily transporter [Bernardetia litoralis DSM 6794]|uniref:Major Facilitator Superfamily transporter n=1 Tax=Bernardetia litoralis (strain ATCC 23117 / DSM 6794 / NBRC 15988 / NCIMB 1366 / Fx l1 / Sio-4) TaxID=880071 RepID=I4AIY8_BERLS|nr:MFS transporter [Bernardetia litoralis]AFM03923.1 Major Facilitator Superfamily transporter [Bernardetia litoralis DSM 6794]
MENTLDTKNNTEDSIKITLPTSNSKRGQGSKRIYKRPELPITVVLGSAFLIYGILYHAAAFAVLGAIFSYDSSETAVLMNIRDISYIVFTIVGAIIVPRWSARNIIVVCLSAMAVCAIAVSFQTHNFALAEFLFSLTGGSFALVRLAAYWLISLESKKKGQHARRIMHLEGMYLLGVALSYVLFLPYINIDSSWTHAYWVLLPFLVVVIGFQFLHYHYPLYSVPKSWKNEFRHAHKSLNGLLVNSILILSIFCIFIASIVYVHFEEWANVFAVRVIDLNNRQFYDLRVSAVIFLVMAISRLLIGTLLQHAGRFMIFVFCIFGLMSLVLWTGDVFANQTIYPASVFSDISPYSLLLPATAFFLAPILPLIYAVIITQASERQQPLVIGLLLGVTMLAKLLFTSLSTKSYDYFVDYTAFYLILIPLALLLVLFFLVYSDLNKDSRLFHRKKRKLEKPKKQRE